MDRFQSMLVFLKVAELGSFTATARAMRMSPSMVIKHVSIQEDRLGVRLFQRSTRRVMLTEVGRNYRAMVERIVSSVEEAETLTEADHKAAQGTLRVNGPVSFGTRYIAPLMFQFHRSYPRLAVEVGLNDRLIDLVDGGWDMTVRIGRLSTSSLVARKLAPCRMALCGSPAYLEIHGWPTRVADLRHHSCLGYTLSRFAGPEAWCFGIDGRVVVPVKGPLSSSNGDALLAAAIAGEGLTYQPTFLLGDAIGSGLLVSLKLDHAPIDLGGVYAMYPSGGNIPMKVRLFVDFLANAFAGTPPWDRSLAIELTQPAPTSRQSEDTCLA